jgi:hypothetical protein
VLAPWRLAAEATPFSFSPDALAQLAAGAVVHPDDLGELAELFAVAKAMLLADGVELSPRAGVEGEDEAAADVAHAAACFLDSPFAAPICAFLNARGDESAGRAAAAQRATEESARAESAAAAEEFRSRREAEAAFCARYSTGDALAAATVGEHFHLTPNDAERISRRALGGSEGGGDAPLLSFLALLASWPALDDAFDRFVRPAVWISEQAALRALIGAALAGYRALPSAVTAPAWAALRAAGEARRAVGAGRAATKATTIASSASPRWPLWAKNLRTVFHFLGAADLSAMLAVSLGFEREACANELWVEKLRAAPDYGAGVEAHVCAALPSGRWDLAPYRFWRKAWVEFRLSSRLVATCVNFGPAREKPSGSRTAESDSDSSDDDDDEEEDESDSRVALGGRDHAARLAIKNGYLTEDGTADPTARRASAVSSVLRYGFSTAHGALARSHAHSQNADVAARVKAADVSSRDSAVASSLITLRPWGVQMDGGAAAQWKNTRFGAGPKGSSQTMSRDVAADPPSWHVELPPGDYRVWAAVGDRAATSSAEIDVAAGLRSDENFGADGAAEKDAAGDAASSRSPHR